MSDNGTEEIALQRVRLDVTEIGSTGLERHSGLISEEFLPELRGRRAVQAYREMSSNDPVVGAILFAVEMLIRGVTWRVEPASQEDADLEAADFLTSCMGDMSHSWEDFVSEVLSMLVYGWSFHELVYKRRRGGSRNATERSRYDDGRVGWRKIPGRSQDTLHEWRFDDAGGLQAMVQLAPPDYVQRVIPIDKALLFRTTTRKSNPEGRSVLRNAYRPWWFAKRIEEVEGIGVERDLAGLPIAWVPPQVLSSTATSDERSILTEIKRIVVNIRRDEQEGVVFPLVYDESGNKLYDLQLLSSAGSRQFDTHQIVTRYQQRMAMVVMADFLLLGHEKVGSFALASSKTSLFAVAIGAWLESISSVLNAHAVPRLFALNGMGVRSLPRFVTGDIEVPDLGELSEYVQRLAGVGALFPDGNLEAHLREVAGFPQREEMV